MVSIFPNLCLWRRSLRSNLGGIDPEKLYRATLTAVAYPGKGPGGPAPLFLDQTYPPISGPG